jgi:xanthine dehydrogenase YagR molybdenum-binding subunit
MATEAKWPEANERKLIGKRTDRVDGPAKTTGAAEYSYDVNLPGMLWAKVLTTPYAHSRLEEIDPQAARDFPGVAMVWIDEDLIGQELRYEGQIVAAVAANTEEIAQEALSKIKVKYTVLEHEVDDTNPELSTLPPAERKEGDLETAFKEADMVIEGEYGLPVITHCCLEPHGQVTDFRDGELFVWPSTQNVSRYSDRLGDSVGVPQNKIHVDCQYMGGGFGAKFGFDKWGTIGGLISKETGRPVKLMLDRDLEMMIGGNRPSAYAKIKVAAQSNGKITGIDAEVWGTGGGGGYSPPPIPYVFTKIPHQQRIGRGIQTNRGGQRAWRAPGHPQGCFLTMAALEDAAAKLGMDALDFFRINLDLTDRPEVYAEQLDIAADLVGYKRKAHLRGDPAPGTLKRGLGIGLHTWGGLGHPSECDVTIHPDGSVETRIGTQDLGTGSRTVLGVVIAEVLGLPFEAIQVNIGKNAYPPSGASGGSTTIGGISTASLIAATAALDELLASVAPHFGVAPDAIEARDGQIREINNPNKKISWKEACGTLGPNPISKRGANVPAESRERNLTNSGVGGVQIADVSVDVETGIVTMNEMVAVQDCGLIIDMKLAESQVYGALIMGITYALFEEALYDQTTGRMLNPDMEFYRLAGIEDVGRLKVHMMTGKGYDERGVIGLGEPPVIAPGAAISNAVANACGVRVPNLPLTPDQVLTALQKGGLI